MHMTQCPKTVTTVCIITIMLSINTQNGINMVKWHHSSLWSQYNLHVVRHDVLLCEVNWKFFTGPPTHIVGGQTSDARWRLSSSVTLHGGAYAT